MIWTILTSRMAGPVAAAAALALGVALGVALFQRNDARQQRDDLQTTLTETQGTLAACQTNARSLMAGINAQNLRIIALGRESEARIATARQQVETANRATAAANVRIGRFLSAPPSGATACERVDDVDQRLLESLR